MLPRLLLLTAALLATGSGAGRIGKTTPAMPTHAFVGVDVIPMTEGGGVLSDRTVLVRGDRIVAIGERSEIDLPEGTVRIDAAGLTLVPGLADMHVHLERFRDPAVLKLFLAHGVTTVRNMDGRPLVLEWRRETASGALPGPTIVTAGPILESPPPFWDDTRVVETPDEARAAVAEQAEAGYDFVKVYHTLSADAYRAAVDEAEAGEFPVAGHVPNEVGLEEVLRAGQASIEHLQGYDEAIEADDSPHAGGWHWSKLYLGMPADSAKARRAAERTAEAGVWNVTTLVQQEKLASLETMRGWLEAPEMRYVPGEVLHEWDPANADPGTRERLAAIGPEELAILERGRQNRAMLVRALHEAGGGLLVGTDTPNPFVVPGVSVHEELESLVEAGLSPAEALAAATREAARFLGVEEVGTVQTGKRADLVLLDGDPLEAIGSTSRIAGVMARGVWLPRAEIDAMLEEVVAAFD